MATLPELEARMSSIEKLLGWIAPRARQSSNVSKARVESVSDKNFSFCNVVLLETNLRLVGVPITMTKEARAQGQMPTVDSIVYVEHQGEGQNPKITQLATEESDMIDLVRKKQGPAYISAPGILHT